MVTKNWLITGASSGLGDALARAALDRGDQVAATFRKAEQAAAFDDLAPGRSHGIRMDITDPASVQAGVAQAVSALGGRLDVVVNNAGYALVGLVEQISDDEALQQIETNVLGSLRVVRATLPVLRGQRSGRYINLASLAATVGFPMLGIYCASKFAVQGMTEALAGEIAGLGLYATSVEPGGFRTNFGTSSMVHAKATVPGDDYADLLATVGAGIRSMADYMRGDPQLAAQKLLQLADMPNPPVRFALGDDALPMITAALEGRLEQYRAHAAMGQGTSIP